MALPIVSVLMPAYNHEKWVEAAVRSVFAQSYQNVELVVVDDGSTDSTRSILQELASHAPIRMSLHSRNNQGVCRTLNECLNRSSGSLVAHLASDNLLDPRFIERVEMVSRGLSHRCVVHTDADNIIGTQRFSRGKPNRPPAQGSAFYAIARGECRIISSSVVFPRWLWAQAGPYDERLVAEDFDMHLRQARFAEFAYIDEPLFCTRKVPSSLGQRPDRWIEDVFIALDKHRDMFDEESFRELLLRRRRHAAGVCSEHGQANATLRQVQAAFGLTNSTEELVRLSASLGYTVSAAVLRGVIARNMPSTLRRWRHTATNILASRR